MAQYKMDIVDVNLNTGNIHRSFLSHTIGQKDEDADRFGVRAFRDGVPVDLSGCSCHAWFLNSQGTTLALTDYGTVDGNEAYVTLPQACYDYDGQFCLAIKLVGGGISSTVRIIDGVVDNIDVGGSVSPTSEIPDYSAILSQYAAMVAATSAANTAIAETFDATKAYPAGKYVINTGALYRLTADHAANVTWANTSKVAAKIGDDVSDLKSAIDEEKTKRNDDDIILGTRIAEEILTRQNDDYTINENLLGKVKKPITNPNGNSGQILRTLGNGDTEWVDQGLPTYEQTVTAIAAWLNAHPEATTTVEDHSLTTEKFVIGTLEYVTPQMFGAKANGVEDDTIAMNAALSYPNVFIPHGTYKITDTLRATSRRIIGEDCIIAPSFASWKKSILSIVGVDTIEVYGIEMDANNLASFGICIDANDGEDAILNHIVISNCKISNLNNLTNNYASMGIYINRDNRNVEITNCNISNMNRQNSLEGRYTSAGIGIHYVLGTCFIQGNTIDGSYFEVGGEKQDADGIKILTKNSLEGLVEEDTNIIITNNIITNCQGRFVKAIGENIRVVGNTMKNTGIELIPYFTGVDFQTGKGSAIDNVVQIVGCTATDDCTIFKITSRSYTKRNAYGVIQGNNVYIDEPTGIMLTIPVFVDIPHSIKLVDNTVMNCKNAIYLQVQSGVSITSHIVLTICENTFYNLTNIYIGSSIQTYLHKIISDNYGYSGNDTKEYKIDYAYQKALIVPYVSESELGNNNAGFHNSIYRGKNLGNTITQSQFDEISAGTFNDLYIGDYWVINSINWRIAAFDYWYMYGDTACTAHHIVVVPDTNLIAADGETSLLNHNDDTSGAYAGSDFWAGTNGNTAKAQCLTLAEATFGDTHILTHREYLKNAASGYETGASWYDSNIDLMSEQMVFGSKFYGNISRGTNVPLNRTIDSSQLPLFMFNHTLICIRYNYWLRDVASTTGFEDVDRYGIPNYVAASNKWVGIRPIFGVK